METNLGVPQQWGNDNASNTFKIILQAILIFIANNLVKLSTF